MEKALKKLFAVITEEAASNVAFSRKLEDAMGAFAETYQKDRKIEREIEGFNPLVALKALGAESFHKRVGGMSAPALKLLIQKHNLDPSGALQGRASKAKLVDAIVGAAEKRAARDAKLFEY
ncbi:MAG: hypothetical protein AAF719_09425 [Pseudomonadota bacterium]